LDTTPFGEASEAVLTPMGAVLVRVTGGSGAAIEVERVPVPRLPDGMAVDGVQQVRLRINDAIRCGLPLNLHVTANREGHPDSGQWLDSVAYVSNGGIVQVAVRDSEWLEARGVIAEVAYETRGLRLTVNEAPAGALLHVSVVWLESDLPSTYICAWFAADLALPD
jgi:hypothetical protein